jgi:hypothetical protein
MRGEDDRSVGENLQQWLGTNLHSCWHTRFTVYYGESKAKENFAAKTGIDGISPVRCGTEGTERIKLYDCDLAPGKKAVDMGKDATSVGSFWEDTET